jgi:glycerol-3-phosphate dehydrogenase
MHLLARKWKRKLPRIFPADGPIYGGDIGEFGTFLNKAMRDNAFSLKPQTIKHLVNNYGSKYSSILDYLSRDEGLAKLVPGSKEAIKGELVYSMKKELTCTLSDLLLRRTDIGSAGKPSLETVEYCADLMAEELGWNQAEKEAQKDDFLKSYDRVRF